jgi:hypothetical protein
MRRTRGVGVASGDSRTSCGASRKASLTLASPSTSAGAELGGDEANDEREGRLSMQVPAAAPSCPAPGRQVGPCRAERVMSSRTSRVGAVRLERARTSLFGPLRRDRQGEVRRDWVWAEPGGKGELRRACRPESR